MLTLQTTSRIFAGSILGAVISFAPLAHADDAAADAAHPVDATVSLDASVGIDASFGVDATQTVGIDAAHAVVDSGHMCIGIGEPCLKTETCCVSNAYCGSFTGTGNSLVCGVNDSDTLPTGSCSVGKASGADAFVFCALVGLAFGVRRKRRA